MPKFKRYFFSVDIEYNAESPEEAVETIHNELKNVGDWAEINGMVHRKYGSYDCENINYNKILGEINEQKRKK